eukprot:GILK01009103.1.p1 GENE.GILK01009103.1~~GILK01009103.1.p1  ORF type:complete len:307 (+),score=24.04 GILK01009103.1:90-923(+)
MSKPNYQPTRSLIHYRAPASRTPSHLLSRTATTRSFFTSNAHEEKSSLAFRLTAWGIAAVGFVALALWERSRIPRQISKLIQTSNTHEANGDLAAAAESLVAAVSLFDRHTTGTRRPQLFWMQLHLGELYDSMPHSPAGAVRRRFKDALLTAEESFGTDSREVGLALDRLAQLEHDNGSDLEAENLYRKALSIFQAVGLSVAAADYAGTLHNLSQLLISHRRVVEGEKMLLESLQVSESYLSKEYSHHVLQVLAAFYDSQDRPHDKREIQRKLGEPL